MSQKDELTSEQKKELTKIAAEIEAEAIQIKPIYLWRFLTVGFR